MKKSILLTLAALAVVFAVVSPASAKKDPGCSGSSSSVALNQAYTVSAFGLPTGSDVNLVVTYPNGTMMVGVIPVNSDGTFTTNPQSAGAAGTYTYQFVGKVRWPDATFNQTYAACSVQAG